MIDITRKSVAKLRGLICFYQRRNDHNAVRTIENEIRRRTDKPKRRKRKKAKVTVPLEVKLDPRDCAHDWIPIDGAMAVNRFQCRICGVIGWQDRLLDGRVRVYVCQHQDCHRPVQGINAVGGRYCQKHYFDKPLIPRGL